MTGATSMSWLHLYAGERWEQELLCIDLPVVVHLHLSFMHTPVAKP